MGCLVMSQADPVGEEIDWTHFTFQHGFRQLPQQLPQQLYQPPTNLPPSAFANADTKVFEASQSPSPSLLKVLPVADQHPAAVSSKHDSSPSLTAGEPATSGMDYKQEPSQHAQQGLAGLKEEPSQLAQQARVSSNELESESHAEHAELKEEDTEELAGNIGTAAEREEGHGSDEEGEEGQRLTRSRRGNAAGLYMLDHGSQLIPKKARSVPPLLSACHQII